MASQNPIADIYHVQLEASRRFAEVIFTGTQRIDHVVIESAHRAFRENLKLAHAAVSVRDPKEIAHIQSSMLTQRPDGAVHLQKELMRVFAEIQNEMGKSMKDYMEHFSNGMARSATAPLKPAQERSGESALNPVTGMFSIWESAFHEAAQASRSVGAGEAAGGRAAGMDAGEESQEDGESDPEGQGTEGRRQSIHAALRGGGSGGAAGANGSANSASAAGGNGSSGEENHPERRAHPVQHPTASRRK